MQRAIAAVCPFGERRADIRAAVNSANIIRASMPPGAKVEAEQMQQLIGSLSRYLKCDQDTSDEVDLDALKRMQVQQCQE
jgi:hypothetical protein